MEALIFIVLIFFLGIGFVFEILGFIFRLLFSGFGLIVGLIGSALLAIIAVPLLAGIIGFILPQGIIFLGIIVLSIAVIHKTRKQRKETSYNRDYNRKW